LIKNLKLAGFFLSCNLIQNILLKANVSGRFTINGISEQKLYSATLTEKNLSICPKKWRFSHPTSTKEISVNDEN